MKRVEVLNGVNLNMLGLRDPEHYGTITLPELEAQIEQQAAELGLRASCFATNSESEYVQRLHALRGEVDGLILNPGSWTHYAWSIHDALELVEAPAVEVHISDIGSREPWRRVSVIGDLCLATISGHGPDGYREALALLCDALDGARGVTAYGAARLVRLAKELRERELDGLLVARPIDLRYLTGFTGSHGLALISSGLGDPPPIPGHLFLTDFRYQTQSAEQVDDALEREIVGDDLLAGLARTLGSVPRPGGRLAFDEQSLTVAEHTRLGELLGAAWELVPGGDAVRRLRAVKDAGELARIRAASELADEALRITLQAGLAGRTEREVAIELELAMRRLGAEAPSFPSIVAAAAHAALPHAEPRAVEIPRDALVTIDWGALHEGYCSDCTRTYATGESIASEAREVYELVRTAQEEGLAAVRAGPSGRDVDAVARELIEAAGYGKHFGHGLGHGVGMEVHEGPRLSRHDGDQPLQAGNVVTIEPGVYLPGRLGVRIEDLVVVRDDGHEVLTGLPKELTVVA